MCRTEVVNDCNQWKRRAHQTGEALQKVMINIVCIIEHFVQCSLVNNLCDEIFGSLGEHGEANCSVEGARG